MAHGIQQADVCIICALQEEADAVEQEISERCKVVFTTNAADDGRFVYRSTVITNKLQEPLSLLLFCQTRPGPVSTALDLGLLLQVFRPRFVGMSGICAGDKQHVQMGDLVVAEYAYHYQEGKTEHNPQGGVVHHPAGITYGPLKKIIRFVHTFDTWQVPAAKLERPDQTTNPPRCFPAVMASGMTVQGVDPFPELQRQQRKTWALDMEAAAFYETLRESPEVASLVVKAVSDYADQSKNDEYHTYAAHASAIYLLTFIQEYVTDETIRRERRTAPLSLIVHSRRNPFLSVLQNQNRERMLRRLRRSYSDLMKQSLQGVAWLELSIAEKPDAVQNAANLLLRTPSAERHLPPGTSITEAYDNAEQELLILGESGTGKSTLLLDLAQHLVVRAEQDQTHPLPVILPLSSWAIKRPPLQDWIVEQLAEIYDVPRVLSAQWVQEGSILPLLDGLDEMEEVARPVCIVAINTYHRDHLAKLVVCSRTTEYEAATERHRLALQGAVVVQPLTHEDVDAYLVRAGQPLTALHNALKTNAVLYDLTTIPLMLNILIVTYQGTLVRNLPNKESFSLQRVWNDYVELMVIRKGNSKRYPLKQTRSRLCWLAQQMRNHNQAVFYLEHLQPDWLPIKQQRVYSWQAIRLPAIVIGVLMSTLFHLFLSGDTSLSSLLQYGLVGGLLGGIWQKPTSENQGDAHHVSGKRLIKWIATSVCIGAMYGLSFGLNTSYALSNWFIINGLSYGIAIGFSSLLLQYLLTKPIRPGSSSENSTVRRRRWIVRFISAVQGPRALLVAIITELSYIVGTGLVLALNHILSGELGITLRVELGYGLSFGLAYVLLSLALGTHMGDIHPNERIGWTWRNLRGGLFNPQHLRITVLITCISLFFISLSNAFDDALLRVVVYVPVYERLPSYWLSYQLRDFLGYQLSVGLGSALGISLAIGLGYWFLLGLFQGITQERIEDQDRRVANQGIHRSILNSVIMGIISSLITGSAAIISIGLSSGLRKGLSYNVSSGLLSYHLSYDWLSYGLSEGLRFALPIGISGGLLICVIMGGLATQQHYVLRLLLWRAQTFPWNAPQFLDDATSRSFLRRVGGGYGFSHRLLLDHLADATPLTNDTAPTAEP